jgi:flagellar basal-body rod modification protein FlgD
VSVPAIESAASTGGISGLAPTAPSSGSADKDMFLQLMVAQLRYQDPLNPADSGEFLAQNAQFTALEKMQQVADQTSALLAAQVAFGAAGLVGRQISWIDENGDTRNGTVSGVSFDAAGPILDVGGTEVPIGVVQSVHDGSAPPPPTPDPPADPAQPR